MDEIFDFVVIGGGIVGLSTAMHLQTIGDYSVLLIEKENNLAKHQTGNNSGVIHSGIYYRPGSLKALNCSRGRTMLIEFCNLHNIKYNQCGKLIVANSNRQIHYLNNLYERGLENGLSGIEKLTTEEIKEFEPEAFGVAGIYVPQTGIIDYKEVAAVYAKVFMESGGAIRTNTLFQSVKKEPDNLILFTSQGEIKTKNLVNCGGLYADIIAKKCGVKTGLQIVPFRGEYYKIIKEKEHLVKSLIYPVPDPEFPFLGVHFTKMINGGVEAGPNAVLSFKREGYEKNSFNLEDTYKMLTYPGFWKLALKHFGMGLSETYRSFSKKAFTEALQRLVPAITEDDIVQAGSGVRAQALDSKGTLIDDFRIIKTDRMAHVLNAPSPAATASLSIGERISEIVLSRED